MVAVLHVGTALTIGTVALLEVKHCGKFLAPTSECELSSNRLLRLAPKQGLLVYAEHVLTRLGLLHRRRAGAEALGAVECTAWSIWLKDTLQESTNRHTQASRVIKSTKERGLQACTTYACCLGVRADNELSSCLSDLVMSRTTSLF
jgi:hypothetical protein